ncbi:hypothetical protein [Alteromonas sp. P256]|uniref:hypothetical protein n=1 Tax=Alteromonas sp. P256 TaxID=3117399 RepID=UPI002FE3517C
MDAKQKHELLRKSVSTKARAALLAGLGVCFLSGCSNALHQAKVEELNTDYCTEKVQHNCRYIAAGFLRPVQPNDAFEEQLKPIHEREEVIEQEFEVLRRK